MRESDFKIKHLDMIQNIISRLAKNSFIIKGWEITIVLAGIGFYANNTNKIIYLYLVLSATIVLWALDAYYLSQERRFRKFYEQNSTLRLNSRVQFVSLSMKMNGSIEDSGLVCIMFSYPVALLYFPLVLMLLIYLTNINFLKEVIF